MTPEIPENLPTNSAGTPLETGLLRFLLEHIPDRIYFKDRQSHFLRISRAMAEFFSLKDPDDAIGRSDFDFFTREHAQPAYDDEQHIMQTGEPIVGQVEKETLPDGRIGWAITTKMPLRDAAGSIIGTCGISKDFTSQKALEESLQRTLDELRETHEKLKAAQKQLIEAEKIQSLGRLAFGVAHEVRNPLNTLNMAAEFLGGQPAVTADATMSAIVGTMKEAVTRANLVITELADASGAAELSVESGAIGPVIERSLETLAEPLDQAGIAVDLALADGLPAIPIDPKRMEETLTGIFRNALDAMPAGGRLTVRAHVLQLTEADTHVGSRSARKLRTGDRVVRIESTDTGSGIARERLDNVFDPFFTTKATGKGMGLGLTVARKIVELHGGRIEIESIEGEGARVVIDLPIRA